MDNSLVETDFTTKDILNFLHSGPDDERDAGMQNFDWRNIFNTSDQIIRMFNQYGEVTDLLLLPCFSWIIIPIRQLSHVPRSGYSAFLFRRSPQTGSISLPCLLPGDFPARPFETERAT